MIKGSDRYAIFVVGLLLAVGIFYLAVPQSLSALKAQDGVRTATALASGGQPESDDLRKLAVSRADALVWGENPAYARELAHTYHRLSRYAAPEARKSVRLAAHDASERELRARPLNAIAWWRLGVMRAALDDAATSRSASYLWQSVHVQRNAMNLIPLRLRAISDNWFRFDTAQRRDVRPQFAAAWRLDPEAVIRIAENPRRGAVIRAALATEPRLLGGFEKALPGKP